MAAIETPLIGVGYYRMATSRIGRGEMLRRRVCVAVSVVAGFALISLAASSANSFLLASPARAVGSLNKVVMAPQLPQTTVFSKKSGSHFPVLQRRRRRPDVRMCAGLSCINCGVSSTGAIEGQLSSPQSRLVVRSAVGTGRHDLSSKATLAPIESLEELLVNPAGVSERFVFCGGKGGVGKTTTAAAIGVKLAEEGHNTLVVSTDPAHSLGDAYDEDLRGKGSVFVGNKVGLPLYAMEIDTDSAMKTFSDAISGLDLIGLAQGAGISIEMLETVGAADILKELSALFENPPPGVDEIVAISQVIKLIKKKGGANDMPAFDRVIFDTAPTGHTLRLLSLPKFLDGFVAKTIKLRARVGGLLNSITSLLGIENTFDAKLNKVVDKLEEFQRDIQLLKQIFENPKATEFIVVTIPTEMAVKESERLVASLDKSKISARHIVVNKVLKNEGNANSYLSAIKEGQDQCLSRLNELKSRGIDVTKVPYFDSEVTGVPALQYMSHIAFQSGWEDMEVVAKGSPNKELSLEEKLRLMEDEIEKQSGEHMPRFVIMGGKGGVGKTSCSSALAINLALKGAKVAVVSTDPAHSLGDSLKMELSGQLQTVPGLNGNLYAMEIDTEEAIGSFRNAVQEMVQKRASGGSGGGDVMSQLKLEEFAETLETPPPGADELVALSQMLNIVKQGTPGEKEPFDYVVVDTAPTGHTLRLLSLPEFLEKFFNRLRKIRDKVGGATSFLNMFMGSDEGSASNSITSPDYASRYDDILSNMPSESSTNPVDRLQKLQDSMTQVTNLLKDRDQSQFCIVTIPTILAVAETERLVDALEEQKIRVSHVIANQVVASENEDSDKAYINRVSYEQGIMMKRVDKLAETRGLNVVKAPYFDAEVRSVYGLKMLGDTLFEEGNNHGGKA
eukprot:CAMPEP_0184494772 /NCGR_PEP_ID=MMETSP0113_2-20130426/29544_1 /TAXON_ID=91329 /ORGANISM="Norrisiella sphaerica, Strain BC52" /LENGTH=902 /DNA_ID=CAMNT_0026880663 /DNA_START=166 /DNA_END=2874 /DNA_ORIENTATION=+